MDFSDIEAQLFLKQKKDVYRFLVWTKWFAKHKDLN